MSVDFSTIGKNSSYVASQEAAAATTKSNTLDQADFLKLLTTQLSNQDPSSPVDNNQMVTTMSQLSVVQNLSTITKGMDNITSAISSSSALSASSLVGKSVLLDSSTAYFDGQTPVTAQIDAGDGVSNVKIAITDSSGAVVSEFAANEIDGTFDFGWNGVKSTDEDGNNTYYDMGKYTITVTGEQNGEKVSVPVKTYGTVSSVVLGSTASETKLNIRGVGEISLDKVENIAS